MAEAHSTLDDNMAAEEAMFSSICVYAFFDFSNM